MRINRILAALFCVMTMANAFSVNVSAKAIDNTGVVSPMYEIAQSPQSTIDIFAASATCTSSTKGKNIKTISAVQTLEKYNGSSWDAVKDASWTSSVNSKSIYVSNSKSGLSSGKYRLKTVFTLTDNDGKTETVTVYSTTASC